MYVSIMQHLSQLLKHTNSLNMKESSILVMNVSIRKDFSQLLKLTKMKEPSVLVVNVSIMQHFSQLLKLTNSLNMKESSIIVMNVKNVMVQLLYHILHI